MTELNATTAETDGGHDGDARLPATGREASADAGTSDRGRGAARPPKWTFLSFVHHWVEFEQIVGGEQVRPYELFTSLAGAGHAVRVYDRHTHDAPERRLGRLIVRPLPLPAHRLLRKVLFWPALYVVFVLELLRARLRGTRLCLYQTLPWGARDLKRIELFPAFVLFRAASLMGATTWGALHDLPLDHFEYGRTLDEQEVKEEKEHALARRAADVQLRQVRHADFVTVVSENMRRVIVERTGIRPDKIRVFRSSVNPDHVRDLPPWEPPQGRPWRIGFLGHAADAQLPHLIEAAELLDADERVELLLAGDGTPELGRAAGVEVRCFGDVKYADFAAFAREIDVWAIPYADMPYIEITWQLKAPMNVATGRPVVMTETAETKHSGLAPYLHPAGSTPESIAEQIDAIIADPVAAKRLAAAGRAYLLEEMTWRRTAVRLVDQLNQVVGSSSRTRRAAAAAAAAAHMVVEKTP